MSPSMVGDNPLVLSSGASPFAPNPITPFQKNGSLPPQLAMPMIYPVLENLSVTFMLPPDSP